MRPLLPRVSLCSVLALGVCAVAVADLTGAASNIMVMQARAMASIPGAPAGVVYLTLHNAGGTSDRLLGASTPLAQKVEMHGGGMSHGVAIMRPLEGIDIAVGSIVEFKTGGNHLMLIGLQRPLTAGMVLPLTLKFQKSGEQKVNVPVMPQAPAASSAPVPK
jgi:periplasmic copper chaperone A